MESSMVSRSIQMGQGLSMHRDMASYIPERIVFHASVPLVIRNSEILPKKGPQGLSETVKTLPSCDQIQVHTRSQVAPKMNDLKQETNQKLHGQADLRLRSTMCQDRTSNRFEPGGSKNIQ